MTIRFDPVGAITALVDAGVDFIVVGQLAAVLHGHPEATIDLDVVPRQDLENAERLIAVLVDLGAVVVDPNGEPTNAPPEERDLLGWQRVLETNTSLGPIDIVPFAIGVGSYTDLITNSSRVDIEGREVWVASLDDVIASKEAAGRPKDLRRLPTLRAFRDRLHQTAGNPRAASTNPRFPGL